MFAGNYNNIISSCLLLFLLEASHARIKRSFVNLVCFCLLQVVDAASFPNPFALGDGIVISTN